MTPLNRLLLNAGEQGYILLLYTVNALYTELKFIRFSQFDRTFTTPHGWLIINFRVVFIRCSVAGNLQCLFGERAI